MDIMWYENFFQGIALDFWRKATSRERTRLEVDFLERTLCLQSGARVLDVPCGGGRHAIELVSRGYRVTGVDLCREAISEAQERSGLAGLTIECVHADMRELPWSSEFDGAFCFGNSFGYLDPIGTDTFVQAIARTLRGRARFALDSGMAAESILPNIKEREWMQVEDILFLEENRYHAEESCMETIYTFVRKGETIRQTGLHWVYTLREIRNLLSEAGLHTEKVYGSLDGNPFQVGSPYLLLVAERR